MSTAAVGVIAPLPASLQTEPSNIERLLVEVKSLAGQLTEDASDLVSYSHRAGSWESLLESVGRIKEHIDAAHRVFHSIDVMRLSASPLQRNTIDHVGPLLNRIASGTARLIHAIDENPQRLSMGEYRNLIDSNSDFASQFAALISAFIDFSGRPPGRRTHAAVV